MSGPPQTPPISVSRPLPPPQVHTNTPKYPPLPGPTNPITADRLSPQAAVPPTATPVVLPGTAATAPASPTEGIMGGTGDAVLDDAYFCYGAGGLGMDDDPYSVSAYGSPVQLPPAPEVQTGTVECHAPTHTTNTPAASTSPLHSPPTITTNSTTTTTTTNNTTTCPSKEPAIVGGVLHVNPPPTSTAPHNNTQAQPAHVTPGSVSPPVSPPVNRQQLPTHQTSTPSNTRSPPPPQARPAVAPPTQSQPQSPTQPQSQPQQTVRLQHPPPILPQLHQSGALAEQPASTVTSQLPNTTSSAVSTESPSAPDTHQVPPAPAPPPLNWKQSFDKGAASPVLSRSLIGRRAPLNTVTITLPATQCDESHVSKNVQPPTAEKEVSPRPANTASTAAVTTSTTSTANEHPASVVVVLSASITSSETTVKSVPESTSASAIPTTVDDSDENRPPTAEEIAKLARMRAACIREIVTTEQTYLDDLRILEEVFLIPLKSSQVLREDEINKLFSNFEMLLPIHKEVLDKLWDNTATNNGEYVGDIFKSMSQYFKMYTTYCANHDQALLLYDELKTNSEWMKFLSKCHDDKRAKGVQLIGYIIKPVQRICKYPLFFRELIKDTPPEHPDYPALLQAQHQIEEVVKYINEGKRVFEMQQKIMEINNSIEDWEGQELITPTRRYVTDQKIRGIDRRNGKEHEYKIFVFTDLVVVAKIPTGKIETTMHHKLVLKGYLPMTQCRITNIIDSEDAPPHGFQLTRLDIMDERKQPRFIFYASCGAEKQLLLRQIHGWIVDTKKKFCQTHKRTPTSVIFPGAPNLETVSDDSIITNTPPRRESDPIPSATHSTPNRAAETNSSAQHPANSTCTTTTASATPKETLSLEDIFTPEFFKPPGNSTHPPPSQSNAAATSSATTSPSASATSASPLTPTPTPTPTAPTPTPTPATPTAPTTTPAPAPTPSPNPSDPKVAPPSPAQLQPQPQATPTTPNALPPATVLAPPATAPPAPLLPPQPQPQSQPQMPPPPPSLPPPQPAAAAATASGVGTPAAVTPASQPPTQPRPQPQPQPTAQPPVKPTSLPLPTPSTPPPVSPPPPAATPVSTPPPPPPPLPPASTSPSSTGTSHISMPLTFDFSFKPPPNGSSNNNNNNPQLPASSIPPPSIDIPPPSF
ncbi:calmodulin-binding protein [Pelomyxa schiedti]|nr:calmodulin-binding protein [Pelomyxa schiedti]